MADNVDGIKEGTPVTMHSGSDCYPGVVIAVTAKSVTVQHVQHGNNKEQWPSQDYDIFLDKPHAGYAPVIYRRNKYGNYMTRSYSSLGIGKAKFYQDPSF